LKIFSSCNYYDPKRRMPAHIAHRHSRFVIDIHFSDLYKRAGAAGRDWQVKNISAKVSGHTVFVKRIRADHDQKTFKEYLPLNPEMRKEIELNIGEIFDGLGGAALIKSSGDVYIKPNGVGHQPYAFTRPEVLEAAIRYWFDAGARKVYLFENSTQATYTRLVFELIGYNALCGRTGAVPVYLDEDDVVEYAFSGKNPAKIDPRGYALTAFRMPRTVHQKLIVEKDANLYVNIPKLKTHSMSVVTLGIKNQWGFPVHQDRSPDHNYNLHHKIVDVLSHVRPDVTLIEGVEGTIYGHYPALALADRCVRPFKVLVGGLNVVAVDIVGARILGKRIADVPHLKLALERRLGDGIQNERDITIAGDYGSYENLDILNEWSDYGGQYPDDLIQQFPDDIVIVKGREMACREGCVNNTLNTLQLIGCDHPGRGGWSLMMGKGFDDEAVDRIEGPVLVVGPCAVKEVGRRLTDRLGRRKVYFSHECNDLRAIVESLCHLMRVSPLKLAPRMNLIKGMALILQARMNKSSGRMTNPLANFIKLR
jgi:uncharacterized protein (DUF362 family)